MFRLFPPAPFDQEVKLTILFQGNDAKLGLILKYGIKEEKKIMHSIFKQMYATIAAPHLILHNLQSPFSCPGGSNSGLSNNYLSGCLLDNVLY